MNILRDILKKQGEGKVAGIPSYCTANPQVLKAILINARDKNIPVLIEATANQVNQFGGYTGMKPVDYKNYLYQLAEEIGCPAELIILGGDHLGPLTWQNLPEEEAMKNSIDLVKLFVGAGYTKIHLDTSMRVADDDPNAPLLDETIARRGVTLYKACMEAYEELLATDSNAERPCFIIGSEVPIPGGSQEEEDTIAVTKPEALKKTLEVYEAEFERQGCKEGFADVVAVVVQPGVEFGNNDIHVYNREAAALLCEECKKYPNIMLEGHSTDYQPKEALKQMVEDGVGILKVGPQITFALREALFALSHIEEMLADEDGKIGGKSLVSFPEVLENVMLENPKDWIKHYHGTDVQKKLERKYSLSDRCRYYFSTEEIQNAIANLYANINSVKIPLGLLHQYMPKQFEKVACGKLALDAESLVTDFVCEVMEIYEYATDL